MSTNNYLNAVSVLAEQQWGLFTHKQAINMGLHQQKIANLEKSGLIIKIIKGVYKVSGTEYNNATEKQAYWLSLNSDRNPFEPIKLSKNTLVVDSISALELYDVGDLYSETTIFSSQIKSKSQRKNIDFIRNNRITFDEINFEFGIPIVSLEHAIVTAIIDQVDKSYIKEILNDGYKKNIINENKLENLFQKFDKAINKSLAFSGKEIVSALKTKEVSENNSLSLAQEIVSRVGKSLDTSELIKAADRMRKPILENTVSPVSILSRKLTDGIILPGSVMASIDKIAYNAAKEVAKGLNKNEQ